VGRLRQEEGGGHRQDRHRICAAPHPSPIIGKGPKFLGSRPFSAINAALSDLGCPEIDWSLD
jgi:uracil-DNA glycosylase